MKHQNRIAQRILTEARRAWERNRGILSYKTKTPFTINDNINDQLIRRMGAERPGIEMQAVVFFSETGEPEHIELTVKTLSPPYLGKSLNFYNDLDVEAFGGKIGWVVDEVIKGNGKVLSTPEDDYNDHLTNLDYESKNYDDDWHREID